MRATVLHAAYSVTLGGTKIELVRELSEYLNELLDLGLRVRGRHLDPKTDLGLRDERVRGESDVDALVEEEAPCGIDVLVSGERYLDDRKARTIRGVDAQTIEAVEHLRGLVPQIRPNCVAACLVDLEAGEHGCE